MLDVLQVSSVLYRALLGKGYFVLVEGLPWLVEWVTTSATRPSGAAAQSTPGHE